MATRITRTWQDAHTRITFEEERFGIGQVERTMTVRQGSNEVTLRLIPDVRNFIEEGLE